MTDTTNQKTILVIDDNAEALAMVTSVLQDEFSVIVAKTGETGLRLAADSSPQPSLILLDYLMPDMNGDEVCHALKNQVATRDIPVVFLTGAEEELAASHLIGIGAVECIKKTIGAELLLECVRYHADDTTT